MPAYLEIGANNGAWMSHILLREKKSRPEGSPLPRSVVIEPNPRHATELGLFACAHVRDLIQERFKAQGFAAEKHARDRGGAAQWDTAPGAGAGAAGASWSQHWQGR